MNWKYLLPVAAITILTACDKNSFQTKPQIKLKSTNGNVLAPNETLSISLEFTDKEGDLGQAKLVYIPIRLNKRPLPTQVTNYDSVINILPQFPDKNKGEFEVRLAWRFLHKSDIENDTIHFRFVAVDRAGNKSDTLVTDKFVILKQ